MLLAQRKGKLIKAVPNIYNAICPHCEKDVIPRCGSIRTWHWAHRIGECIYDTEPETEWHLEWKDRAFKLGLEVEKRFDDIQRIADIYSPKNNTVIEVQHSPISEIELMDRCADYSVSDINLKWIFDKTRKFEDGNIILDVGRIVEFKEKRYQRALDCLFDKTGYPIHDISYHISYQETKEPILLKIGFELVEGFLGINYIFDSFNDEHIIEELRGAIEKFNTIEELHENENIKQKLDKMFGAYTDNIRLEPLEPLPLPEVGESTNVRILSQPRYIKKNIPNKDGAIVAMCKSLDTDKYYELYFGSTIYKGIISELKKNNIPIDSQLKCVVNRIFTITGKEWLSAPSYMWNHDELTRRPIPPKIYGVTIRPELE